VEPAVEDCVGLLLAADAGVDADGEPQAIASKNSDAITALRFIWITCCNGRALFRLSAGLIAWVSVPDLHVHPSGQRYTYVRRSGKRSIVRYQSSSRDFVADLTFDQDGLCVNYPGLGRSV
jgi:hypothetical protein